MLFVRCLSNFTMTSPKQHSENSSISGVQSCTVKQKLSRPYLRLSGHPRDGEQDLGEEGRGERRLPRNERVQDYDAVAHLVLRVLFAHGAAVGASVHHGVLKEEMWRANVTFRIDPKFGCTL